MRRNRSAARANRTMKIKQPTTAPAIAAVVVDWKGLMNDYMRAS